MKIELLSQWMLEAEFRKKSNKCNQCDCAFSQAGYLCTDSEYSDESGDSRKSGDSDESGESGIHCKKNFCFCE